MGSFTAAYYISKGNTVKLLSFIDESGEKGYNDRKPDNEYAIGVAVAIFINSCDLDSLKEDFMEKFSSLQSLSNFSSKLHIADIPNEEKETLRKIVVDFVREKDIKWTYKAIYMESFYQFYNSQYSIERDKIEGRYLTEEIKKNKEDLHWELLDHVSTNSYCYAIDNHYSELDLLFDNINSKTLNKVKDKVNEILNVSEDPEVTHVKVFDLQEKKVIPNYGKITSTINWNGFLDDFKELQTNFQSIKVDENILLLIPDVISNWLNYYLENEIAHPAELGLKDTIFSFPLYSQCYANNSNNGYEALLRHPSLSVQEND